MIKELFGATVLDNGPSVVSTKAMIRKQGNGNYTGFIRTEYSDSTHSDHDFIVNAKSIDEVREEYLTNQIKE